MSLPLSVQGLTVRGEGGRVLLSVPSLEVRPGQAVAVRGPSGAGKSTLLFALAGIAAGCSGRVNWGRTDLLGLSAARRAAFRRQHMGLIFQDFLLFEELGAAANAALPAAWAPRSERAGIRARAGALLDGLGVPRAARRVERFSGGERQRVAVARALAGNPAVILADEPTASLDRSAADRLIDDLVALARDEGRTLIAVSHDERLHGAMDRVLTVADGRIAADTGAVANHRAPHA